MTLGAGRHQRSVTERGNGVLVHLYSQRAPECHQSNSVLLLGVCLSIVGPPSLVSAVPPLVASTDGLNQAASYEAVLQVKLVPSMLPGMSSTVVTDVEGVATDEPCEFAAATVQEYCVPG